MSTPTLQLTDFEKGMHRTGRITNVIAIVALIAVPLVMTLTSDVPIQMGRTLQSVLGIFSLMGILAIVEFMSYAPLLGAGATYLTFVTGNTMNLKLPSAMSSVRIAGVEPHSKEADVISMMAVAVSSLVTIVVLVIGMLAFSALVPVLQSPTLKPAFDNLMPALMGALGAPVLLKDMRTASVPAMLGLVITLVIGYAAFSQMTSFLLPVFMVVTLGWRYLLYRRDMKKTDSDKPDQVTST